MNYYQIVELAPTGNHAGYKAPTDVAEIAEKTGFKKCFVRMNCTGPSFFEKIKRQIGYAKDWNRVFNEIQDGSVVLLQHPFYHRQITRNSILKKLKTQKNVKFICFVHDIEQLRNGKQVKYFSDEFNFMKQMADVLIVHNKSMLEWFESQGFDRDKFVVLSVFDYLHDVTDTLPCFSKSITIAGNLGSDKSKYIKKLGELENISINLYGPNFDDKLSCFENIHYCGSFPAEEIPSKLTYGFGLVWDGESLTECSGDNGNYLRYNSPHKLSLYLASGMPVIIWSKAAEAMFVKENGVGLTINSLFELYSVLDKVDGKRYRLMAENVLAVKKRITGGVFTQNALSAAVQKLCNN